MASGQTNEQNVEHEGLDKHEQLKEQLLRPESEPYTRPHFSFRAEHPPLFKPDRGIEREVAVPSNRPDMIRRRFERPNRSAKPIDERDE